MKHSDYWFTWGLIAGALTVAAAYELADFVRIVRHQMRKRNRQIQINRKGNSLNIQVGDNSAVTIDEVAK